MELKERGQWILLVVLSCAVGYLLFDRFYFKEEIVYINTPMILAKYEGMKDAEQEFKRKAEVYKANLDTLYNEFQESLKEFEKGRSKMTPKELKLSEELLENKRQQLLNYQEAAQKKASQEETRITENALKRVNELIKEYGKAHGYTFIMAATNMGNILYAKEKMEVTKEVLDMLNKKYKEEHGKK